jgi:hypothetical protein
MRGGAASIFLGYRIMLRRRQCAMKKSRRHVVNNARPLLIALPRYGNMPAMKTPRLLVVARTGRNHDAETQN